MSLAAKTGVTAKAVQKELDELKSSFQKRQKYLKALLRALEAEKEVREEPKDDE